MKVKYNHPSVIPFDGVELETEYDLIIKGEKALLSRDKFSLELTKFQAETMFEKVEETKI
jgi:hypothetical protein